MTSAGWQVTLCDLVWHVVRLVASCYMPCSYFTLLYMLTGRLWLEVTTCMLVCTPHVDVRISSSTHCQATKMLLSPFSLNVIHLM